MNLNIENLGQISENEIGGDVERKEQKRNALKVLTEEPEGKRPLGRPRCRNE
jgi:hypothetical protein